MPQLEGLVGYEWRSYVPLGWCLQGDCICIDKGINWISIHMKPSNNARIVVCTNGWSMDVGEEEETSRPNVIAGPAAAGELPRARSQAFLLWDFLGHGQIVREILSGLRLFC